MTSIRDKNGAFRYESDYEFLLADSGHSKSHKWRDFTMNEFKLKAPYEPTGDQPQAIAELVKGFKGRQSMPDFTRGYGFWKDFTMANVIQQLQKPTLVIAHNKTLTAQLYGEFKEMFPDNAVEYFVPSMRKVTK